MAHAFGHARGPGRVEPEGRLVAQVSASCVSAAGSPSRAQGKCEGRWFATRHEHVLEERELTQYRLHDLEQWRRNEESLGAAVAEDVGVLLRRQQRVEAHRHNARLDGAPERNRKIDRIEQEQCHARLARDAVGRAQIGHTVGAGLQLAVGQRLVGIDESRLGRPAQGDVAVDHVRRRIVDARIGHRVLPIGDYGKAVRFLLADAGKTHRPTDTCIILQV